MFYLDPREFRGGDRTRLVPFVECWERYYRGTVTVAPANAQPIDYFAELNVGAELTRQNVTRLLRWKDPRLLTHPKRNSTGNKRNLRVVGVLNQLEAINSFRRGDMNRVDFTDVVHGTFRQGIVWQLFLFHIARPWEWPIADQHVFRAYSALFGGSIPNTLESFDAYRTLFHDLAKALPLPAGPPRAATVEKNKRLDNALMAYGQFLRAYDR